MFGFGWTEIKIFLLLCVLIFIVPFLFSPISTWNDGFWTYLHETAPIMWLGQLGWIVLAAALGTLGIYVVKEVFG